MYEFVGADDWQDVSLYETAKWKNGLAFKNINFSESGLPVIKIAELKNGITEQTKFTKDLYSGDVLVERGDMLFAWSGSPQTSIDTFIWDGVDGWLNQHIFKITPHELVSAEYLFFLLKFLRPRFVRIALNKQTTGLGHVTVADLKEMRVGIPDRVEQESIVSIVGPLQQKIENNRRMNETLEEMARAIFKSWFVDFDPVHAKAAGNPPVHMDANTAALFSSTFNDDGLPTGWIWRKMGDCVSLTKGRSYKSVELQESDTALVTLKSFLRGGGYRADGLKPYTGKYKDEQTLASGDLIVALTDVTQAADVIGKPAIVRSNGGFKTLVASLDVGVLRPTVPSISIPFLYCLMMTNDFQAHIYGHTSGTTVLHLGKHGVPKYEFAMPSSELLAKFTAIAAPIFSKIELNETNSNTLANLRDTLLPKLMSGELQIPDAEKFLEKAGV